MIDPVDMPSALPHGPIARVVHGVFLVRGTFRMGPLMRIGRSMCIVQQGNELVILNAVRLSPEGEAELDRLGSVKHLVKLSDSHRIDEPYYLQRYAPTFWVLPGAAVARPGARQLGPATPIPGAVSSEYPGICGWRESALWIPNAGGTLITCDAVQNHSDGEGTSPIGRVMTTLLGFKGGVIVAPMWRKFQKVRGAAVGQAFGPTLARRFENLVTGHVPAVAGGAGGQVKSAVAAASA